MSYCKALNSMEGDRRALHSDYHDKYYGFPIHDDDELFCQLILEINQAGLSWETVLKKQPTFRKAYSGFKIKKVAAYTEADRKRLMGDAGIIRNRLKINAAIENAKTLVLIQKEFGSFQNWLGKEHPKTKEEWVKLFKKTFRFTGGEIVNEFLMSTSFLPGAHEKNCPVFSKVMKSKPHWASQTGKGKK
jgi:DNA-3-methyladenine glycosylase I